MLAFPSADKVFLSSYNYLQTAYPNWHASSINNIAESLGVIFHNEKISREQLRQQIIAFEASIEGPRDGLPDLAKMLENAVLSSTDQGIWSKITSCVIL